MLNPKQRAELNSGIGASEVAAVLGINPYMTPYQLWRIKLGLDDNDISNKPEVIMGNLLEPVIAERYAQKTGTKVARVNDAIRHPKYPHILCHLDRRIVGVNAAVEIKKANPFSKEWGDIGSDEIPKMFIAQTQQQHLCKEGKLDYIDLATFRGGADVDIYKTFPDKEAMQYILDRVNDFWFNHILTKVEPEPSTRGDLKLLYPINDGEFKQSTPEVHALFVLLKGLKITLKEKEEEKEKIEKDIIQFIADKDGIIDGDRIMATFKADKNGTRRLSIKGEK